MSKPGARPLPTVIKRLNGNPGRRPLPENEPTPKKGRPACPRFLTAAARREWRQIVPELESLGLLSKIDKAALAAYCQAYARWGAAETALTELTKMSPSQLQFIYKTTNGNLVINPLLSIANKAMEQMKSFLVEFGMTPSSRVRTSVPDDDADDPMERALNVRLRKN